MKKSLKWLILSFVFFGPSLYVLFPKLDFFGFLAVFGFGVGMVLYLEAIQMANEEKKGTLKKFK